MHKGNIVWFGLVSTEKQDVIHRINHLIFTPEIRLFLLIFVQYKLLVIDSLQYCHVAKCNI